MTVKTDAFTVYVSALHGQQPTRSTSPLHVHEFGTGTLQHFYPAWCLLETSTRPSSLSSRAALPGLSPLSLSGKHLGECGWQRRRRLLAVMSGDVSYIRGLWQASGRDLTSGLLIFQISPLNLWGVVSKNSWTESIKKPERGLAFRGTDPRLIHGRTLDGKHTSAFYRKSKNLLWLFRPERKQA